MTTNTENLSTLIASIMNSGAPEDMQRAALLSLMTDNPTPERPPQGSIIVVSMGEVTRQWDTYSPGQALVQFCTVCEEMEMEATWPVAWDGSEATTLLQSWPDLDEEDDD